MQRVLYPLLRSLITLCVSGMTGSMVSVKWSVVTQLEDEWSFNSALISVAGRLLCKVPRSLITLRVSGTTGSMVSGMTVCGVSEHVNSPTLRQ